MVLKVLVSELKYYKLRFPMYPNYMFQTLQILMISFFLFI